MQADTDSPAATRSKSTSTKRRLVASFGANTFGRFTTTIIQLISVPVFLSHWGAGLYGEWLLLSAIPYYFSLSDIGFGSVAGNEMTMLMGAQRQEEALEVFQSVWVLTTALSTCVGLLLLGCIWFIPFNQWLHLHLLSTHQVRMVVLLLGLSVLLGMQETLFQAAFRCVGRYAYGTLVKNTVVLASFGFVLLPVVFGGSPENVAFVQMLVNAIGTFIIWLILRREIPWIRFGVKFARRRAIRRLTVPAVSMMSVPISISLSLQGMLILVGHVLGPMAVVTFSTARTISRSANQVMQLINGAVWPEISTAFGAGNLDLARRLHRRACQLSIALCSLVVLAVASLGQYAWRLWTVGKVVTDPVLLYVMLFQLLVSSLWYTSSVIPVATNRNSKMAKVILSTVTLSLFLAWAAMKWTPLGLRGVALSVVVSDLINTFFILRISLDLLEDPLPDFLRSMFTIPALRFPRFKLT